MTLQDTRQDATVAPLDPFAPALLSPIQLRALVTVAVAAGKDGTLPTLTGIRVEVSPDAVTFVATDRYRLAVVTVKRDKKNVDLFGDWSALIPATELVRAIKALPKNRTLDGYPSVRLVREDEYHVTLAGYESTTTLRTLDGDFPKWRPLIPTTDPELPSGTMAMSPKYLADVAKMPFERNMPARVRFYGDNRPMLWTSIHDECEWTYLLMPVRSAG